MSNLLPNRNYKSEAANIVYGMLKRMTETMEKDGRGNEVPALIESMITNADEIELKDTKARQELLSRYTGAKIRDFLTVVLLLSSIIIVIYLFTTSLFEGFIAFVAAIILIKTITKSREKDWPFSGFA